MVFFFEPHLVSLTNLPVAAFLLWLKSCLGHVLSQPTPFSAKFSLNYLFCDPTRLFAQLLQSFSNLRLQSSIAESQTVSKKSASHAVRTYTCIPAQRENHTVSRSLIQAAVTMHSASCSNLKQLHGRRVTTSCREIAAKQTITGGLLKPQNHPKYSAAN